MLTPEQIDQAFEIWKARAVRPMTEAEARVARSAVQFGVYLATLALSEEPDVVLAAVRGDLT